MIVGLEIPMNYHILFITISFIIFIITILLLFLQPSFEQTIGAFILSAFNILLSLLIAFMFSGVDLVGFDSTGAVVHNVHGGMHPLALVFMGLIWINIMFMFYGTYLFIKKPWQEIMGDEFTQGQYQGPPY